MPGDENFKRGTEQFNRILAELSEDSGLGRKIWALFSGKSVA